MARRTLDELSVAAPATPAADAAAAVLGARLYLPVPIVLGAGLGLLAVLTLAQPGTVEPSHASLVRLMVSVKGLLFAAAVALVAWRLGRPVRPRELAGYGLGLGLCAGALVWLWGLSALLIGSILFYGGLGLCYLTGSSDPWLLRERCGTPRRD
jgi:hypothetical protein